MRRREFIALLGGSVAGWPLAARPQQTDRVRLIGVLMATGENDPETKGYLSQFTRALREVGWPDASVRMDVRFAPSDIDRVRMIAKELHCNPT